MADHPIRLSQNPLLIRAYREYAWLCESEKHLTILAISLEAMQNDDEKFGEEVGYLYA